MEARIPVLMREGFQGIKCIVLKATFRPHIHPFYSEDILTELPTKALPFSSTFSPKYSFPSRNGNLGPISLLTWCTDRECSVLQPTLMLLCSHCNTGCEQFQWLLKLTWVHPCLCWLSCSDKIQSSNARDTNIQGVFVYLRKGIVARHNPKTTLYFSKLDSQASFRRNKYQWAAIEGRLLYLIPSSLILFSSKNSYMKPETVHKINKPSWTYHFKLSHLTTNHFLQHSYTTIGEKKTLRTELNITFFHISTTLAAYASMWIYLCLWSWLILAPGLNNDCMKRSRKAGTRIWRKWMVY